MIGLRGTGSKRVVCEDVFVPEHRAITAVGTTDERPPGWRTHENPLYAGGLFSLLFFELGAIAVGAARGAIDVYEEVLADQAARHPAVRPRGEVDEYQQHLGHAIGLVDVAEAALLEGADRYLEQATRAYEADTPPDENGEETRRLLVLQQHCIRLAGEAVDLVFRTGGTSGARSGQPDRQRHAGADGHANAHGPAVAPDDDEPRPAAAGAGGGFRMTTVDDLVAAADALRPRLLEEQAATEQRTRYSEELHETFRELGFYRLLQPRRYGGLETDVTTFYRVMMSISRGCPSTGWMLCLGSGHALQVASFFREEAQAELFGDGHFVALRELRRPGRARRRRSPAATACSGTWHFCSGAPYATHHIGLAPTPDDDRRARRGRSRARTSPSWTTGATSSA